MWEEHIKWNYVWDGRYWQPVMCAFCFTQNMLSHSLCTALCIGDKRCVDWVDGESVTTYHVLVGVS